MSRPVRPVFALLVVSAMLVAPAALGASKRRAARHSEAMSKKPVSETVIPVKIKGRNMRPQVVIDIKRVEPDFAVGTQPVKKGKHSFKKPR